MIEGRVCGKPAFLASVTSFDEARIALAGGADVIDCKDPSRGALGALDTGIVESIVREINGETPVSATIGDLPPDPSVMCEAAAAMAKTGVDIVKIGFFGDGDPIPAIRALGAAKLPEMVAVLMADRPCDEATMHALARHGFAGVMLDTADKHVGRLTDIMSQTMLARFVKRAEALGLCVGLAGSLAVEDIPTLSPLRPDIIGFRGALCANGRTSALNAEKVSLIRREIDLSKRRMPEKSVA